MAKAEKYEVDPAHLSKPKPQGAQPPMKSIDALELEITKITLSFRPKQAPPIPISMARWWITMQEPAQATERPRLAQGKRGSIWITPYTDRLIQNFKKFCQLTTAEQDIVIGCYEDGVYWRGDDIKQFYGGVSCCIYSETMTKNEIGLGDYKPAARTFMKKGLLRFAQRRAMA